MTKTRLHIFCEARILFFPSRQLTVTRSGTSTCWSPAARCLFGLGETGSLARGGAARGNSFRAPRTQPFPDVTFPSAFYSGH